MARLAICAFGLALAAPSARAGHGPGSPADLAGLLQTSRSSAEASFDVLTEESGGKPKPVPGYSPEDYDEGMLVETRLPNGTWVAGAILGSQPGGVWDVKIPGDDLKGVPASSLRRRVDQGESDWLVLGNRKDSVMAVPVAFRRSKNLTDVDGTAYALPNSLVVGRGEADGWVQTRRGYLPIRLLGEQVLAERARRGTAAVSEDIRDWSVKAEDARRRAAMAKAALDVLAEESGGQPKPVPGYSPEDYKEGMLVETQLPNGTWVAGAIQGSQPGDVWDVKIPGDDLQGVPVSSLRRRLDKDESDWLVSVRVVRVAYRRSKNLTDVVGTALASPDSLVVGRDEADGWVKTRRGYLPIRVLGEQVFTKRDRRGTVAISEDFRDWYVEAEDARRRAAMAKAALRPPLPPAETYKENEEALFQTGDGAWCPARVVSSGRGGTYDVLVRPAGESEYMVPHASRHQLRKAGPKRVAIYRGGPACYEGGCIKVLVRLEPPPCPSEGGCTAGEEKTVQTARGATIQKLVESACAAIESTYSCDTRLELWHRGRALPNWWRTFEAGLEDGAVVDAKLAPVTVTPITELSG